MTVVYNHDESKLQFFVSIKFRESFSREVDFTLRGGAPEDLMYLPPLRVKIIVNWQIISTIILK